MTIRSHNGTVEVATHTYTKGDRHVVLFGVSHIAGHEFWKKSNTFIAELEEKGFEIHFEGVTNDMDTPAIAPNYKAIADLIGLQDQHSGLSYKKHWKRTDTTTSKLLSKSSPEKIAKAADKAAQLEELIKNVSTGDQREAHAAVFLKAMKLLPYISPVLGAINSIPSSTMVAGISKKSLIDDRNDIAVQAILGTDRNVAAVWGALHLPGIGRSLRREGFTLATRQWHPAY